MDHIRNLWRRADDSSHQPLLETGAKKSYNIKFASSSSAQLPHQFVTLPNLSLANASTKSFFTRLSTYCHFVFHSLLILILVLAAIWTFLNLKLIWNYAQNSSNLCSVCCNESNHFSEYFSSSQSLVLRAKKLFGNLNYYSSLSDVELQNESNENCSFHSCFDIYQCGIMNYNPYELPKQMKPKLIETIKVFMYSKAPTSDKLDNLPYSFEYYRLLDAVRKSRYYTDNPHEACLFIPAIDMLNLENADLNRLKDALYSLPHFSHLNGSNHVLISMIFTEATKLRFGKAIVAGGNFDNLNYRLNFDISIPVYSLFSQLYETYDLALLPYNLKLIAHLPRKWTLISTQIDLVLPETRYHLISLESTNSDQILLLGLDCNRNKDQISYSSQIESIISLQANVDAVKLYNETFACNTDRQIKLRYVDVLHESEFCLIQRTGYLGVPLLSDALMAGCVPVFISDQYILPFAEVIDWPSISVRVWENSVPDLLDILEEISPERRHQMRIKGQFIWNRYFRTVENITVTILDIINNHVYPRPRKVIASIQEDLVEVSPMSLQYYNKGFSSLTPKGNHLLSAGFTAVILTYNRVESLFQVISSLTKVPSCQKIVVIWNSQLTVPPEPAKWPASNIPIQVIQAKKNHLSNRFYPFASIETEAIFSIDDDITMLTPDEIEFAYQTWRDFPDRIVGFPSRLHYWNNQSKSWSYDSEWKNKISMILTGAAFYHKYYNFLYTYVMPSEIRQWVDDNMNCEDIAMNFMVANFTCKAPIKVTPRKKFKCPECTRASGLSSDVLRHLQMRSRCVDYLTKFYQMMPLKGVEFRANPVLYRDNIPEKFKHFNMIGNL